MNKRTQQEVDRQIDGIKSERLRIPEFSMFGDKNWEKMDAQISVLSGINDADYYYEDESADEFEDGDNEVYHAASEAEDWLNGRIDEDLFSEA